MEDNKSEQKEVSEEGTPRDKAIEDKLEKLSKSVETTKSENIASQQLAKLVAIPLVREIMQAQQDGKDMKLVEVSGLKEDILNNEDSDDKVDLEELSRAELVKFTAKQTVKAIVPMIEKIKADISDSITPLRDSIVSSANSEMEKSISEVKKKYPDFDKHMEKMGDIHKKVAGSLNVEELYILSKFREGTLFKETGTDSEKPDSFGIPDSKPSSGEYRGHGGMKRLLDKAVDEVFESL